MKFKSKYRNVFIILGLIACTPLLLSWGIYGHEHINRAAVLALPSPLQNFFYNHIDFITEESTVPDLRKYTLKDKAENPRHFIDLENYGPVEKMPHTLAEIKIQYTDSFLQRNGILPWYIQDMMEKLTTAFKQKRKTEILFLAADLGHYLGDANMPLHTSVNHDGQLTNQKGIHALWESQLPEMFGDSYNYFTGEAKYIDDVEKETWRLIIASHQLADTLLAVDRDLRKTFPVDKIFKTDANGKVMKNKFNQPIFSDEYAGQLNTALKGMIEKQMRASIAATGDFWFTAWVNAGKPDLSDLDDSGLTSRNSVQLNEELNLWKQGKLTYVKSEKEF